jgi:hypothetical protein
MCRWRVSNGCTEKHVLQVGGGAEPADALRSGTGSTFSTLTQREARWWNTETAIGGSDRAQRALWAGHSIKVSGVGPCQEMEHRSFWILRQAHSGKSWPGAPEGLFDLC